METIEFRKYWTDEEKYQILSLEFKTSSDIARDFYYHNNNLLSDEQHPPLFKKSSNRIM